MRTFVFPPTGLTPDGRSVDKSTWKTIQVIMNDTQKFSELINNLQWNHGISDDILKTVVAFFAPTEDAARGPLPRISQSSTPSMRAVTNQRTPSPGKSRSPSIALQITIYKLMN